MNILVYDSGIGGRSVYNLLDQKLSKRSFHLAYFADTAHYPYGTKSETELAQIISQNIQEFTKDGIDTIIVACNTASAIIENRLRAQNPQQYKHVYTIIAPTLQLVQQIRPRQLKIIGSNYTIEHHVYGAPIKELFPSSDISEHAEQHLINLIETRVESEIPFAVRDVLSSMKEGSSLLLGCTHFSLIKNIFEEEVKKTGKNIALIDPAKELFAEIVQKNNLALI